MQLFIVIGPSIIGLIRTWAIEEDVSDSKDNLINVFLCILTLLDAAADRPQPPTQEVVQDPTQPPPN